MTTFAELQTDCYEITKRPDLVAETAIAIRKATMKFHMAEDWIRDRVAAVVPVTPLYTGDFRYQIDTTALTRFRKVYYIQQYLNPPSPLYVEFKKKEGDDLLDSYHVEDTNYFYQIGTSINVRADRQMDNLEVVYYQLPNVTQAGYSSWIADMYPDCIIREVMLDIFQIIGKITVDTRAREIEFSTNLQLLKQMGIV